MVEGADGHERYGVLIIALDTLAASVKCGGGGDYRLFTAFLGELPLRLGIVSSEEDMCIQVVLDNFCRVLFINVI